MRYLPIFAMVLLLTACGGSSSDDTETETDDTSSFTLSSSAIVDGELLAAFQCEEKTNSMEDSIPLSWSGAPDETQSFAVIMHHYPNASDTTSANSYLLLWGIDAGITEIAHGTADDGPWYMGVNKDGNAISYTSPCSPTAESHSYTITLYALSADPAAAGYLPAQSSLEVDYAALKNAIKEAGIIEEVTLTFNSTSD